MYAASSEKIKLVMGTKPENTYDPTKAGKKIDGCWA